MRGMNPALQTTLEHIRHASAHRQPLRIRGGGSKDFVGQRLQGEVLDTRGLCGIVSYEPTELVVTAQGGTPLAELEAALAEKGQCLPFEPPHFGAATVGGMVAAGLSGPARASVGAVRDYVLGAQVINGRGEVLVFGGQVMKNVAGYDVSRLMAGAMGTLGVLAEVSLKVLPVAPAEATLRFDLDQAEALAALHRWGGQPLPLNASCWVQDQGHNTLFVRLRGAVAAVDAACRSMGGERLDNATVAADWRACGEQTLPFFTPPPGMADACLWRLSVPQTTPVLALGGQGAEVQLVEWQGGLRWLWAPEGQAQAIRAAAQAAGGHATLWRVASGGERRHPAWAPLTPVLLAVHQRLKAEFDPAGIFNPGRMYAEF
jgi:glycolate oxidase FAD binding subunit